MIVQYDQIFKHKIVLTKLIIYNKFISGSIEDKYILIFVNNVGTLQKINLDFLIHFVISYYDQS
jgi:hypothetical protein